MTSCKKHDIENIGIISILDDEIENYPDVIAEVKYASDFLPALSDLSDYTNIRYSYRKRYYGLLFFLPMFVSEGVTLFVEYPEDIYEQKKAETLANYEFIAEEIYDDDGDLKSPLAQFEYKGYSFQADINEETVYAVKSFVLVGHNDETNKIAYCYFYDFDLDVLAWSGEDPLTAMHRFMDGSFYWNDAE
jgi:hypothetical protein